MFRLFLALLVVPLLVLSAWWGFSSSAQRADFVVASDELRTIDPQRVSYLDEMQVAAALFEGLMRPDAQTHEPEPAVAEHWEISEDRLTYTFSLRAAACWSDGAPVSAGDFRQSWLHVLEPETEAQYVSLLFVIDGAEAYYRSRLGLGDERAGGAPGESVGIDVIDARTLRVRLSAPCPYFLELLMLPVFAPVHAGQIAAAARAGAGLQRARRDWTRPERVLGNGAFVLAGWDFKQRLLLARNPRYWDAASIELRTIEIYLSSDQTSRLVAYLTRRVDLVSGLEADVVREVRSRGDETAGELHVADRFATFFLRINCRRDPLDSAELRKALSLAIDREAICRHVLGQGEAPAWSYVPRPALARLARRGPDGAVVEYKAPAGLGAGLTYAQSADLAREHLRRSGFDRRATVRPLELAVAAEPAVFRRVAEAIQEMWERELGLRIEPRTQESKVLSERIRRLDYDIVRSNWFGDYLDPSTFLDMFTSVGNQNRTGWAHAGYDDLIAAAAREADDARRYGLLRSAEAILVERELPIIPIYFMRGNHLLQGRFAGSHDDLRGVTQLHRVRLLR
jgi:oligopeptide transport system substrate-binding protein